MNRGNKYAFVPDTIIDLHGFTGQEASATISNLRDLYKKGTSVRIIVGKGIHSEHSPVLPNIVSKNLSAQGLSWKYSKQREGGEGAIDCVIK